MKKKLFSRCHDMGGGKGITQSIVVSKIQTGFFSSVCTWKKTVPSDRNTSHHVIFVSLFLSVFFKSISLSNSSSFPFLFLHRCMRESEKERSIKEKREKSPTGPFFFFKAALCGIDTRLRRAKSSLVCLYLPPQNLPVPVCVG